jgi:hypothetical protein
MWKPQIFRLVTLGAINPTLKETTNEKKGYERVLRSELKNNDVWYISKVNGGSF